MRLGARPAHVASDSRLIGALALLVWWLLWKALLEQQARPGRSRPGRDRASNGLHLGVWDRHRSLTAHKSLDAVDVLDGPARAVGERSLDEYVASVERPWLRIELDPRTVHSSELRASVDQ